ncbi:MAG TPA: GNAT family N-acetyltransferase [archaeon]|nr:GNAT family N-acetyltransferase [archaeon]
MVIKIRIATKKDAKDVAAIIKKHAQQDYMGYATFSESYIKDKMKKNNFFIVSEDRDRIVGCIRASIVDLDLAEIRTLCVDEEYRKQGIATELIQKTLDLLEKNKMRKIVARAKADNKIAINLFKKSGFDQEGYFREHYRKGIDVVQMSKFL